MTIKNQEDLYDNFEFGQYDQCRMNKILPFVFEDNKQNYQINLLDIACGESQFYDSLKKHRKNIIYTGLELSQKQVDISNKKGYNVLKHDLNKPLPFDNESFDMVVATEIIEHIFDTDTLLHEINRILVPGGRLILTTPNAASIGNRIRMLFGNTKTFEYHAREGTSGHIRYFNKSAIQDSLKHNEFKLIKITGRNFNVPFIKYGSKLDFINYTLSNIFPKLSN